MNSRDIMIKGSIAVLGGIAIYLVVNKYQKNSMYKTLMDNLTTGAGATGDLPDLQSTAFSNSYYKKAPAKTPLKTYAQLTAMSKSLDDYIGVPYMPWTQNHDRVLTLFTSLQNKYQASQLAENYFITRKKSLLTDLQNLSEDNRKKLSNIIASMK